jgi:iron(III) transport system ATP-binding protein
LAWSRLTQLAHRYPAQLSGGEARRVSLARAIAPAPACLLLDEPLIYLDPASKMEILTFLGEQIRQSGTCIIYVTHDEKESEQICERLARMEGGQLFHLKQAADEGHNP